MPGRESATKLAPSEVVMRGVPGLCRDYSNPSLSG